MPIVSVDLVADDSGIAPGLARAIADAVGDALGAPPGRVWVRIATIAPDRYAENRVAAADTPAPVFVTLEERELPVGAALDARIRALTFAVARAVGREPSLVHVELAPPGAGRRAFGGTLVR
jgi:phenylpyruvate tautomerase PptA (4-oxalocrotonate tautomerase family)